MYSQKKQRRGPNDPCWCGSGKKFKKCHMGRADQAPQKFSEAADGGRKVFRKKYCSCPSEWRQECDGNIVKAHTIPKSGSLKKIARNSLVYYSKPTLESLVKHRGNVVPELFGIKNVSTFTGFCHYHDQNIFTPLENQDFTGDLEQCFLLAYRATAREHFMKSQSMDVVPILRDTDKGRDPIAQHFIQNFAMEFEDGSAAALRTIERMKKSLDEILLSRDYSNVRHYTIFLKSPIEIMCSGDFFPEYDINGIQVQRPSVSKLSHILTCSAIASESGGVISLVWLKDSDETCMRFVKSLHAKPEKELSQCLVRLMFEYIENIALSPPVVGGLDRR